MYSLSATASALKDYTSTSYILQKNKETVSSNLSVVERESLVSKKKCFETVNTHRRHMALNLQGIGRHET
jgi:hypothetical protein